MLTGFSRFSGSLTAAKFAITDVDSQFLYTPPSMTLPVVVGAARVSNQRMLLAGWFIQNRSGGVAVVGIGTHFPAWEWVAGQWVNDTTTYTDDTTDAQDDDASDFAIETTTASDGHIVAADRPFNIIGYNIGTASVGAGPAPVRDIMYSLADGTWTALPQVYVNPVTGAHWATGERAVIWSEPQDWDVLVAGHGTGVPLGKYGIRIRATTAPSGAGLVAALATRLVVGHMLHLIEGLADNGIYEVPHGFPEEVAGAHIAMCISRDVDASNTTNDSGSRATGMVRVMG